MTEKELRKLKRSDFLQLLLAQGRDMSELEARLDEKAQELEQLRTVSADLRSKLDEKDRSIQDLSGRLNSKDATIAVLRQEIEDMKAILKAIRLTAPEGVEPVSPTPQSPDESEGTRDARPDAGRKKHRRGRGKR